MKKTKNKWLFKLVPRDGAGKEIFIYCESEYMKLPASQTKNYYFVVSNYSINQAVKENKARLARMAKIFCRRGK